MRSAAGGSTAAAGSPFLDLHREAGPAAAGFALISVVQPDQQRHRIDFAARQVEAAGLDPRRRVEIVDRAQQPARLADDLGRAAAIARAGRAPYIGPRSAPRSR
jgi:hypothetical protein